MAWTLNLYFFRTYLATFVKVLAMIALLIFLIDVIEVFRKMPEIVDSPFVLAVSISGLRVPSFLQVAVPFLVLIAAMITLLGLNRRQELVITRASGLSAWQFIAPICAASFLIGIVTVAVVNPLSSRGLAASENLQVESKLRNASEQSIVPWFRQKMDDGYVVIGAANAADDGRLLSDASFFFFGNDSSLTQRIDAQNARLVDDNWRLAGATRYTQNGSSEAIHDYSVPSTLKIEFLKLALTSAKTIPFFALSDSIVAARAFGLPSGPYEMEWHGLVALPALLVAMTLIAATVSLRFARFGNSSSALLGGVLSGFLLYVVTAMAKAFGAAGIVAPVISAWLPVTVAGFIGVTFLLYREDG